MEEFHKRIATNFSDHFSSHNGLKEFYSSMYTFFFLIIKVRLVS